jgi:hypothetical protein
VPGLCALVRQLVHFNHMRHVFFSLGRMDSAYNSMVGPMGQHVNTILKKKRKYIQFRMSTLWQLIEKTSRFGSLDHPHFGRFSRFARLRAGGGGTGGGMGGYGRGV